MQTTLRDCVGRDSGSRLGWIALAGLLALGFAVLMAREIPSMRRELNLMRM